MYFTRLIKFVDDQGILEEATEYKYILIPFISNDRPCYELFSDSSLLTAITEYSECTLDIYLPPDCSSGMDSYVEHVFRFIQFKYRERLVDPSIAILDPEREELNVFGIESISGDKYSLQKFVLALVNALDSDNREVRLAALNAELKYKKILINVSSFVKAILSFSG